MSDRLHILLLEDVPSDAELAESELRKAELGFTARRVETREAFLQGLEEFAPDLILADYALPHFDGMTAIQLARERAPSIPIIVVTGSINEETAVECIKAGATDYVIKEHLARLGSAVKAALEGKRLREEADRAERERERLIAELEAKNAELERFVYAVSHDLRSPLVTITGFLGELEQDVAAGDTGQMKGAIGHISSAAKKMGRMLDELLGLCRIGWIANPREEIALGGLVREALELTGGRITQREMEVDISPDLPVVFGDRPRLLQVLQNLIDNAAKFTGDQPWPRIEIGVRRAGGEGDEGVFYIQDNGVGIDADHHERVFDLFRQLDPQVDGMGVGLALVKQIIELHGGRIWVESKGHGQGCSFCFTLPRKEEN
jgi:signal transduction histidine kinase